jgi:ribosomal protein L9
MDLRIYYQKIRDVEMTIGTEFPVVKSKETADGGKSGTLTEVPKQIAAKLIVDGMAEIATDEELERFRAEMEAAKHEAESRLAAAAALQLTLVPQLELNTLRANQRRTRD